MYVYGESIITTSYSFFSVWIFPHDSWFPLLNPSKSILHRVERRWLRPLPKCAHRWRRLFDFWHPPRAWLFIALTFWGRAIYPIICFGVAPSMHQISCARFFFSPIGFGWVCKSFHGNIAPNPAVFWWIHCRCSHFNCFVGYFQPLLVVAPSVPAFLEFGLVYSCSHQESTLYSFNVLVDLL